MSVQSKKHEKVLSHVFLTVQTCYSCLSRKKSDVSRETSLLLFL